MRNPSKLTERVHSALVLSKSGCYLLAFRVRRNRSLWCCSILQHAYDVFELARGEVILPTDEL